MFRVYLLHPSSYEIFAGSDAGAYYVQTLLKFISDASNPKAVIMLTLRALSNMFKNQSSAFVALQKREQILDAVGQHLSHADKNVRQAAVTLILNYSIVFLQQDDEEGRIQALSCLANFDQKDTDVQNVLRLSYALGNLAHNSAEAASMIDSLGVGLPDPSKLTSIAGDKDLDKHKQTVTEIKQMLFS